jgi:hypothetical protein
VPTKVVDVEPPPPVAVKRMRGFVWSAQCTSAVAGWYAMSYGSKHRDPVEPVVPSPMRVPTVPPAAVAEVMVRMRWLLRQ